MENHLYAVYKHFRYLGHGGVDLRVTESFTGRHGRAYHFQRGQTKSWSPSERGGYTFCYLKQGDEVVSIGVAECSRKDHFCYADGRSLALRRALSDTFGLDAKVWRQLGARVVA